MGFFTSTMDAPIFADDSVVNYVYFALWLLFVLAYFAYAFGFFSLSGLPVIVLHLLEEGETSQPPTSMISAFETHAPRSLSPVIRRDITPSPHSFNIFRQIPERWCWERSPAPGSCSPVWYQATAEERARILTDLPTRQQRRALQERYRREVDDEAQDIIRATKAEEKAVAEKAAAEAQQCKSKASADQGGLFRLSAALQEPLVSLYDNERAWCEGSLMQGVRWAEGLAPPSFMQAFLPPSYTAPYGGITYDGNAGMPGPIASVPYAPTVPSAATDLALRRNPLFAAPGVGGPAAPSAPPVAPPSFGAPSAPPPPALPALGAPYSGKGKQPAAPDSNLPAPAGNAGPAPPTSVFAGPQAAQNVLPNITDVAEAQRQVAKYVNGMFGRMANIQRSKKKWDAILRSLTARDDLAYIRDRANWIVQWGTLPSGVRDKTKLPDGIEKRLKLDEQSHQMENLTGELAVGFGVAQGKGLVAEAYDAVGKLEMLMG